jgi:hypothetical protein
VLLFDPWAVATDALRFHDEFVATAPDELTIATTRTSRDVGI